MPKVSQVQELSVTLGISAQVVLIQVLRLMAKLAISVQQEAFAPQEVGLLNLAHQVHTATQPVLPIIKTAERVILAIIA